MTTPTGRPRPRLLYCAWKLGAPSHLWMRRMLDHVADRTAGVVDAEPLPADLAGRFRYLPLLDQSRRRNWRLRLTRGNVEAWRALHRPSAAHLHHALGPVVSDTSLVHFLNVALLCREPLVEAAQAGRPVFVHCHGADVTWDHCEHDARRSHGDDYQARALEMAKSVTLIANSRFTRRRLIESGFDAGRIVTKPLGVEVAAAPPDRPAKPGPTQFLYLGRLIDFKGPDLTIRAFQLACDRGLDGQLTLAGDGPLRAACEALREQSAHRDRIRMLGTVDGSTGQQLRSMADVFVAHNQFGPVSHQEEAFGVSYVEAMAEGIPVLSGRSGALPETVGPDDPADIDGEPLPAGGILFEPGDVEMQASLMLDLAHDADRRVALGQAGHARALQRYALQIERLALRRILGLD